MNHIFSLLTDTHLLHVRFVSLLAAYVAWRSPFRTLPGLQIRETVHHIDMLKAKGLGFVEKEVSDQGTNQVHTSKDVAESVGYTGVSKWS
jgi:hypothetical protein